MDMGQDNISFQPAWGIDEVKCGRRGSMNINTTKKLRYYDVRKEKLPTLSVKMKDQIMQ